MESSNQQAIDVIKKVHGSVVVIKCRELPPIGVTLPALRNLPKRSALLLGVSMVPRAEIAMLIVFQASLLGKEIVSPELYAAMVLVTVLTSIMSPVYLRYLFKKQNQ